MYTEISLYLRPFTQLLKKRPYPWSRNTNDEPPLKKQKGDEKNIKYNNLNKDLFSDIFIYTPPF